MEDLTPAEFAELKSLCHYDMMLRTRWKRAAQCQGKHRHESWAAANATIRGERRRDVQPYHCNICQGWHTGNREASRAKRLALKARMG